MTDIRVIPMNFANRECVRILCEAELAEPRSGQDPELLNDIAQMLLLPLRPGELEGLRDS